MAGKEWGENLGTGRRSALFSPSPSLPLLLAVSHAKPQPYERLEEARPKGNPSPATVMSSY